MIEAVDSTPPSDLGIIKDGSIQIAPLRTALRDVMIGDNPLELEEKGGRAGSEKFVLFGSVGGREVAILVPMRVSTSNNVENGFDVLQKVTQDDLRLSDGYIPDNAFWKKFDESKQARCYPAAIAKVMMETGDRSIPVCIVERAKGEDAHQPDETYLMSRYLRLLAKGMEYFTKINNIGIIGRDLRGTKEDRFNVRLGITPNDDRICILDPDHDGDQVPLDFGEPIGPPVTILSQTQELVLMMHRACGGYPSLMLSPKTAIIEAKSLFDSTDHHNSYGSMHPALMRYFDAIYYDFPNRAPTTPEQLGNDLRILADIIEKSKEDVRELVKQTNIPLSIRAAIAGRLLEYPDSKEDLRNANIITNEVYSGNEIIVKERVQCFRFQEARYERWIFEEMYSRASEELRNIKKKAPNAPQANGQPADKVGTNDQHDVDRVSGYEKPASDLSQGGVELKQRPAQIREQKPDNIAILDSLANAAEERIAREENESLKMQLADVKKALTQAMEDVSGTGALNKALIDKLAAAVQEKERLEALVEELRKKPVEEKNIPVVMTTKSQDQFWNVNFELVRVAERMARMENEAVKMRERLCEQWFIQALEKRGMKNWGLKDDGRYYLDTDEIMRLDLLQDDAPIAVRVAQLEKIKK
ncbi:hypothetical protein HY947_03920 [Candidatus Gottesmanbacteria bacterium]|nr:hypothetical protein [Candidatus Gottesmanbacteria bacterium]